MQNFKQEILSHFKSSDPLLYPYISETDFSTLEEKINPDEFFLKLTRSIIGQQLSVKAAASIYARFETLFTKKDISPQNILKLKDQNLRDIGISWSKVSYIKDLATKTHEKAIRFHKLTHMNDQDVIKELVQVKGIGQWTGEMFLMFTLKRPDIFSFGDLGLKRAMEKIYKTTSEKKMAKLTEKWKPYRTYAALALWHSLDNMPK